MDVHALYERVRSRGRTALARRFGIDARALAALRMSLGVLLLVDLFVRSRDLVTFYADAGVLPRAALREQYPAFARLSLHAVSGSAWVQGLLFLVAGAAAVALALGYRTTLATVVSFGLLASLHARNPVVLNAGDSILRRLLFWGTFLPLGGRWSVDAIRAGRNGRNGDDVPALGDVFGDETAQRGRAFRNASDSKRVLSVASAALLLQVVVVYVANAAFKLRGDQWLRGEAIRYAFSLEQLTTPLGEVLTEYPLLLSLADRVWLGLLVTAVMLIAFTGMRRAVFASVFVAMHVGMALTMRLGVFPLVSIAALLVFLPTEFWDDAARLRTTRVGWLVDGGERLLRRAESALPEGEFMRGPSAERTHRVRSLARWPRRIRPFLLTGVLALVLVWNAATLGVVGLTADASGTVDPDDHRWDMFAPEPRATDGWYVVPARLSSGERRDALRGTAVDWDAPSEESRTGSNVRWYKYLVDLQRSDHAALRPHFADYLCRRWATTHETEITRLTMYRVEQQTRLDGPEPTERVEQLQYSCSTGVQES